MADSTPAKHLEPYKWQPGTSPNPAGRPKGSRNKLGEAFLQALHESFLEQGPAAIQRVIEEKPDQYLKVIASVVPKEFTLNLGDDYSEMSDDELVERMHRLQAAIAPFLAGGTGDAEGGDGTEAGTQQPAQLH